MLQNYLQLTIKNLSEFHINILGLNIPTVLIIAGALLVFLFLRNLKKLNLIRIISLIIIFLMITLGQYTSDFYLDLNFHDLQNNWHYFAYGIYAFVASRTFRLLDLSEERTILAIFISAIGISTFDEGFQYFISSRIFDISDIAKDTWGVAMGIVFLYMVIKNGDIIKNDNINQETTNKGLF